MAKISRLGGMSDAVLGIYPAAATVRTSSVHSVYDGVLSPAETSDEENTWPDGGDSTTPSSSASSFKPSGALNPFQPVPTTENPSSSDPMASGTASSTDSGSLSGE